ncbi:sensor histidine kinase [Falsiroseomonas tokyonensis]|uniref:sensor histidine kinase n=1 Tax=Falsiroseomonas tokyonensis TaxID=430521 RepID=UPI001C205E48
MEAGPAGRPLAWHLGLLCAALLLPMLALEVYLLVRVAETERARHRDAARDAAHHIAVSLDRGLTTLQAMVEVLATSDHLISGDVEAFRERVRQLPRARDAVLVLQEGETHQLLTLGSAALGAHDAIAERAALETLRPQVSGLLGLDAGAPGFAVMAPVPGPPTDRPRLLSLRVPVSELDAILRDARLPAGVIATITDRDGTVLARSEGASRLVGLRRVGAEEGPPIGEGWRRAQDAFGVPVVVAHAEARVSGWTAWVFMPETAFAAPLRRQLWIAAGSALVFAALAAALALVFTRRIARPIQALAAASQLPPSDAGATPHSAVREVNEVGRALLLARHEAAERLREREEVLAALDLAQVKVVGPDGRILVWTTGMQRLLGWSAEEAIGQVANDLLRSEFPEPLAAIRECLRRDGAWQGEIRQWRRDGTPILVASHWSPRLGPDGRLLAMVKACTDVTALRQAEARLRDTQAELRHMARLNDMGALAAALAHELSQPLTAVANFTEAALNMLERREPGPSRSAMARDAMREAADQAVHAGTIVRRLRDFIGGADGERGIVDLNGLVQDGVGLALSGARQRGVTLSLEVSPRALPVLADPVQIRQVVVNLVRNAIEAMEDSPRRDLRVEVRREDAGFCAVAIADTGGGLPEEVGRRLFEPFVTTKREGMGVGLSICRAIVEEHGGRLAWAPNPQGGAVFTFSLPALSLLEPDGAASAAPAPEEAKPCPPISP